MQTLAEDQVVGRPGSGRRVDRFLFVDQET